MTRSKADYRRLQERWRMVLGTPACGLSMGERDMLRRMVEGSNWLTFKRDGRLVSYMGIESLAAYCAITPRYVSELRRKLEGRGAILSLNKGGNGAKDTAVYTVIDEWLNKVESKLSNGHNKPELQSSPLDAPSDENNSELQSSGFDDHNNPDLGGQA